MYDKPLWCDPPSGWKYGFPKIYDKSKDGNFYEWIVNEGYPQEEIDRYKGEFYCRWWEVTDDNQ